MIKNYLYTIGLYLPSKQRNEILKDIEGSLYEILEMNYGVKEYSDEEIKHVVIDFGNPNQVAQNYLGESLTLISSGLYNEYFFALKIALFGGNIGIILANFIKSDINSINIFYGISLIGEVIQTSLLIFGIVTLIFYMVNRVVIREKVVTQNLWSVDSLKECVEDSAKINRFELGLESIFLIILMFGLFNYLVNSVNVLNQYGLLLFSLFVLSSLILNFYLFLKGKWQKSTRILSIVLNLVFAVCIILFYLNLDKIDLNILRFVGIIVSIKISVLFIMIAIIYDISVHIRRLKID